MAFTYKRGRPSKEDLARRDKEIAKTKQEYEDIDKKINIMVAKKQKVIQVQNEREEEQPEEVIEEDVEEETPVEETDDETTPADDEDNTPLPRGRILKQPREEDDESDTVVEEDDTDTEPEPKRIPPRKKTSAEASGKDTAQLSEDQFMMTWANEEITLLREIRDKLTMNNLYLESIIKQSKR